MKIELKKWSAYLLIIIVPLISLTTNLESRDYWGKVKAPFTGHITALVIDQGNRIYAATWGGGIYRSDNDGVNWTTYNTGLGNLYVNCIKISSSGWIYIGTEGGGIYYSSNGGNSWNQSNDGLTNLNVRAINIKSNGKIFAGTYGSGIFISTNNGSSWKTSNTGLYFLDILSIGFAITVDYILVGTNGGGIYRSSDDGKTWKISNVGWAMEFINGFVLNSVNEVYAASNGGGLLHSVDNGLSWVEFDTNRVDKNIVAMVVNRLGDPVLATRSKGILYYESQNYERWFQSNVSLGGVTAIAINSNGHIFAAIPFEGVYKSTNDGQRFDYVGFKYADGVMPIKASKTRGTIFAAFNATSGAYRSTDNGKTWEQAGLSGQRINCFYFDRNNNVYAGTYIGIYRTTNLGQSWTNIGPQDSIINSIYVAQNNTIFAVGNHFYKTTTGGAPWSISDIGGGGTLTSITFHRSGRLFAASRFFGLFSSTDEGTTWVNNISGTQTGRNNAIFINPSGKIFLGTNNGVFMSSDTGATWTNDGLNVQYPYITDIEGDISGKIYAGLDYGEGIFHTTNNGTDWDSTNNSLATARINNIASNSEGFTYLGTDIIYKSINPNNLPKPELISPDHLTEGINLNPTMNWEPAEKAELYEIQLSSESDFTFRVEYVVLSDTFRLIEKTLEHYTKYYWRVRAKTHSALGPWSDARSFTTIISKPFLISPENNSKGIPTSANFKWYKVAGAEKYTLQLSKSTDFAQIESEIEEITDTTKTVVNLIPLTKYYWRVIAHRGESKSEWSEVWSFTTILAPPQLRLPADKSMEHPTTVLFQWSTSESAEKYFLQIAKDKDFNQLIFDGQTEKNDRHLFTILEYNTTYYWRLNASNQWGTSNWSEIWSFTTGIAAPTLVSPENEFKYTAHTLTFRWEPFDGANYYHIQVATDKDFKNIKFEEAEITEFSYEFTNLESFTVYFWRVRVKINDRWGFFSSPWAFTTNLKSPELTAPDNSATEQSINLYLKWNKPNGAERYHCQVAKDELFENIISDNENLTNTQQGLVNLELNTTYYWRVKAKNSETESSWSVTRNFKTQEEVSVRDYSIIQKLDIYPVPAGELINIELLLNDFSNINIQLCDINGKTLKELNSNGLINNVNIKWEILQFASGFYNIKIKINNTILNRSIIIHR